MKETVVIGVGNLLMADEGVGVHVVRELQQCGREFPGTDLLDLGASGMEVLHSIAGRRKAVIIDCALMGEAPGTIIRFEPEEVRSKKSVSALSFHEGDLPQILDLSKRVGECPDDVVIFGIEPDTIGFGEQLSPALGSRLPEYVAEIERELGRDNERAT